MVRGTFGNIRLRNKLVEREGYWTRHLPDGAETTIFDASVRYRSEGVPLIVIAGKEYGSGSSRDWAAKGPLLLGVRAVIAESFERIHRSNLVGMGILPLEFAHGENLQSLGLTGRERFTIKGIDAIKPGQQVEVEAAGDDGKEDHVQDPRARRQPDRGGLPAPRRHPAPGPPRADRQSLMARRVFSGGSPALRALVAMATGALAVGALAIGALAIGRLSIARARVKRLEIDELVVHRVSLPPSESEGGPPPA